MVTLKQQITHFPHKPGCYLFKDQAGIVLYVGKAKDLRKRVSQYFGQDKRPQLPFLIEDAQGIDYIVSRSELEALFLENTLIKKHNPKYNIKLKDDKNYAFIVIDYSTQIPQIGYARKIEDDTYSQTFVNPSANWGGGKKPRTLSVTEAVTSPPKGEKALRSPLLTLGEGVRSNDRTDEGLAKDQRLRIKDAQYFGPYSSTKKIRETLDFARRIFPYCANTEVSERPCFYYHLHRCPGVCIGLVSLAEYEQNLKRIKLFLNGKTTEIKKEVKKSMEAAAKHKRFELAARLRDQLRSLEVLEERQIAQFPTKVNYDFVSLGVQSGLYCINLFKVRDGKLTDKENFVYGARFESTNGTNQQIATNNTESKIIQAFTEQYYTDATDIPDGLFVQHPIIELSLISELLRSRRGKKVPITLPHRGKALQLIKLGELNAEEYVRKQLETDAGNIDKLNEALETLQKVLSLPSLPRRIECYDMSNTQGTNPVGSMVVFIDGKPAKSEYRKFKIRTKDTPDDFAMMRETLTRRLARIADTQLPISNEAPAKKRRHPEESSTRDLNSDSSPKAAQNDGKAWPRPDLIVIDGGKGQLSAAMEAQADIISNSQFLITNAESGPAKDQRPKTKDAYIPMVGLAKRIEEIFLPNSSEPIILNYNDPALQMLQRLRDEAHRFGITFHRSLRSKQATKSALDTLPGIGPKTKKLLKQKFGSVANVKATSLGELTTVVGKRKAEIIKKNLY